MSILRKVVHHLRNHVGVGILCSVAYFDPGNWTVDARAGSLFSLRPMLFVILMAGLGAIVLQTLACKLGCVTGIDLASHCRLLLHDHPKYPRLVRRGVLYPLYALSEIAIISTDLAELLGSAIGFCLLFPKLPLWAGVVITAGDVLVFLFFSNPTGQSPARIFELLIVALVFAVFSCFIVLLVKVNPQWDQVFLGYVPNKTLFNSSAVYSAVGILGATVMPHALFLGSFLATQDRVSMSPPGPSLPDAGQRRRTLKTWVNELFGISRADRITANKDYRNKYGNRENNSLDFIKEHLGHAVVDIVTSLLLVAVPINSAILIVAATVFFDPSSQSQGPAGLFEAHALIQSHVGNGAAVTFAISLICAGQSSGITATLAGQIVSEGFIEWRISPFLRRLITRLISLIPCVIVAVAVGRSGINTLLVASQVVLSIVLPFVAFPLIYLCSSDIVMRVRDSSTHVQPNEKATHETASTSIANECQLPVDEIAVIETSKDCETGDPTITYKTETPTSSLVNESHGFIDYSIGRFLMCLAYAIAFVVLAANTYALTSLVLNKDSGSSP
ncbi:natural resistance-associated macrophage protein [Mycena floridula]|nr:natural resistance-associated macrophage protein [Mycena floridula]